MAAQDYSNTTLKIWSIMQRMLRGDADPAVKLYAPFVADARVQEWFQSMSKDPTLCQQVVDNCAAFCDAVKKWDELNIQPNDVLAVLGGNGYDVQDGDRKFVLYGAQALALKFGTLLYVIAKALLQTSPQDAKKLVDELLRTYYQDLSRLLGP
jgi:hypothetical protein